LRHWHLGSAYEHWQHCDVSLQSGKYLHPNKVSRILESGTPDFIGYRSPLIADQDEDYVTRGNSIVEKLRKILAWWDIIDVHEEQLFAKVSAQVLI